MLPILLVILLLAPAPEPPSAVPPDSTLHASPGADPRPAHHEFGIWGGGSVASSQFIAKMPDASLRLIGFRYAWPLSESPNFTLSYTADLLSFATLSYPDLPPPPKALRDRSADFQRTDPPVWGAGMTPLGLRFTLQRHPTWQPFVSTNVGFLYFPQPIPDSRGKPFNFAADLGMGLRIVVSRHTVLTLGYRFHHLSNGFRGQINPGFDTNIFYFGISMPR